jgi:3-oxoacyl-[acyl-carrier protein] reductase
MSRVAVITGALGGIGAATAELFRRSGYRVVGLDNRAPLAASDELIRTDVADWHDVQSKIVSIAREQGSIDVMIANAGISLRRSTLDVTRGEWDAVCATNLGGVFACWQAAASVMMTQDSGGTLLATASTNGLVGHPLYADYNASKAGVQSLCRTFAIEFAPKVTANCVSPGYVLTDMQRREYTAEMLAAVDGRIPAGRHASPDEIANAFLFLASPSARYITGQSLTIDGGEVAGGTASFAPRQPRGVTT